MEMVCTQFTNRKNVAIWLIVIIGYWSAGTRLADSARISGQGIKAGDFPEYMVSPPIILASSIF